MRSTRWVGLLLGLGCLVGGGCGDSQAPSPPIVRVGEGEIAQSDFRAAFRRAEARYVVGRGFTSRSVYYDPPSFRLCVRDRMAKAIGEEAELTAAETRTRCERHFAGLHEGTLEKLIESEWVKQEARRVGMHVPDFLDAEARTSVLLRLARRAMRHAKPPTDVEVRAYYADHPNEFTQRETRKVVAIVVERLRTVRRAKQALGRGARWRDVAERYDFHGRARSLPRLTAGADDRVAKAAFGASKGELVGPIGMSEGWYLMRLERIRPTRLQPFEEVRPSIERRLSGASRFRVAKDYLRRVWERSRRRTTCLSALKIPGCRNGNRAEFRGPGIVLGATGQ